MTVSFLSSNANGNNEDVHNLRTSSRYNVVYYDAIRDFVFRWGLSRHSWKSVYIIILCIEYIELYIVRNIIIVSFWIKLVTIFEKFKR